MGGSTLRCPPCGCVFTMSLLCIHLLAPPSLSPSLPLSPPTLPPSLPLHTQSVSQSGVHKFLRAAFAGCDVLGAPRRACTGTSGCCFLWLCGLCSPAYFSSRAEAQEKEESREALFQFFPIYIFFILLFLIFGQVAVFLRSAAPFASRQIRSLSRAVRTGTRRSFRARTVQTQQDFFSLIIFYLRGDPSFFAQFISIWRQMCQICLELL